MGYVGIMGQDNSTSGHADAGKSPNVGKSAAQIRKDRLAEQLRVNLQRRKQQVRARRGGAMDETAGLPASKENKPR